MHSWIENKIMFRVLLCILGLFLPPNFTLSVHYSGLGVTEVRIQHVAKFNLKILGNLLVKNINLCNYRFIQQMSTLCILVKKYKEQ
jgi:hypothetical protein